MTDRNPLAWVTAAMEALEAYEADYGERLPDDHELGRIDESRGSPSFRIRVGHIRQLAHAHPAPAQEPVAVPAGDDDEVLEALKEVLAVLKKEAPGTALNNHRFVHIGIRAYNAVANAEARRRSRQATSPVAPAADGGEDRLRKALNLALKYLERFEPGDSRAVSNEFVAMAAVACDCANDDCLRIIEEAIAAPKKGEISG